MSGRVVLKISGNGAVLPSNVVPSILTGDDTRVLIRTSNGNIVPSNPNSIATILNNSGPRYLDELFDVDTGEPEDGSVLVYDFETSQYITRKLTTDDVEVPMDFDIDGGVF